MPKEENDDDEMFTVSRKEWNEVIRIAREDGMHVHKTYDAFMASKAKKDNPDGSEPPADDDDDGAPPPKKEDENEPPKKQGLWWGSRGEG